MSGNILLSPKHAVNPSVEICFYCKKAKGVALFGKLHKNKIEQMFGKEFADHHLKHNDPQDTEAPREVVLDLEPCKDCAVFYPNAKLGCFLVEAGERETEVVENGRRVTKSVPVPTGNFIVMKDEAIRRIFRPGGVVNDILKKRIAMVDPDTWKELGLDQAVEGGPAPAEPQMD